MTTDWFVAEKQTILKGNSRVMVNINAKKMMIKSNQGYSSEI